MQRGTSRLLMLMISAAIAGCANQTERSSSGAGAQEAVEYERVGGTSNVVTKEELERRAAAKAQAEAAAAPVTQTAEPDYEPKGEDVQYIDTPLPESAPVAAAAAAPAPDPVRTTTDEALPEFPITNEGPGAQAADSNEEVEDLGAQEDESVSTEDAVEEGVAAESGVSEPETYPDEPEQAAAEEVEDLGTQPDESVSTGDAVEDGVAAESGISEPQTYPDEPEQTAAAEEVEDLGTQPDESGTVHHPEDSRPASGRGVSEPTTYPDEAVQQAAAPVSVSFEAEPLFNFNKSAIRSDQRKALDEFIAGLKDVDYTEILAVGHADRLGTETYNQGLSERRANAVKDYLVARGIPADRIRVEGRGESEPVTGDACSTGKRKAIIACLQPDRRVDVSVNGNKKN